MTVSSRRFSGCHNQGGGGTPKLTAETSSYTGASLIKVIRFTVLIVAASAIAQEYAFAQQSGTPPVQQKADDKSVFQRGLEMYQSKNFVTALRAFTEAATEGNVDAMM